MSVMLIANTGANIPKKKESQVRSNAFILRNANKGNRMVPGRKQRIMGAKGNQTQFNEAKQTGPEVSLSTISATHKLPDTNIGTTSRKKRGKMKTIVASLKESNSTCNQTIH